MKLNKIPIEQVKKHANNKLILIDDDTQYYEVENNKEKLGIVGLVLDKFLQIIIYREFRGLGYLKRIIEKVKREFKPSEMYAVINKKNEVSIRAFEKLNYKQVLVGKIPKNHIKLQII